MDIKSDQLVFDPTATHAMDGTPIEPEARPVDRVLGLTIDTSWQTGGATGKSLPGQIILGGTAGEFAMGFRKQCLGCRHFKHEAANRLISSWQEGTLEQRMALNEIRMRLAETQNGSVQDQMGALNGDTDYEHGLMQLGICEPLSEEIGDVLFVHPIGACPEGKDYFQSRDIDAERYGSAKFDQIMRKAQGK